MQQQDGIGVGMSINEGDNAMDQLAATATEHHFNDVLKQLPVQTTPTDSDTTGGTMSMSTTTLSPPSLLQTLVNVNDGKCNDIGLFTAEFDGLGWRSISHSAAANAVHHGILLHQHQPQCQARKLHPR